MPLTVGTQLGSLEITALLGKGGMGEVYRAHDTKLKRDVAIKILPGEFSRDPARASRFQREAEVLASLNHPNIGAIYDLQEANETRFLVLELIEGETLAERIARGPIQIGEALNIAHQIMEALEAAHEKGVIHRDLKPANVKLTPDGKVKVLDFGLAKALQSGPSSSTLSNSPTMLSGTMGGMIIGTAAYMSPEQAKGFEVDARSDTFSFGSVLYEMLTRRQAFQGDTAAEVLASVLVREPDFGFLPPNLNSRIPELLQRCLQKNPKRRWQADGDLHAELETVAAAPWVTAGTLQSVAKRPFWKRAVPLVITALVFAAIGSFAAWNLKRTNPARVVRFSVEVPVEYYQAGRAGVAISPDGTRLVFSSTNGIFIRAMSDTTLRAIPGTTSVQPSHPFFSPDGEWIGFYSTQDSTLKKIGVTGGTALTICKTDQSSAASWSGDYIVFSNPNKGIMRVKSDGGEPEVLVPVKLPEGAAMPQILDNGRLLYTFFPEARSDTVDQGQIVVQSLRTGERKIVLRGGSSARYVPTGHLLYLVGGTLFAVPFDLKTLELKGERVAIIEDVRRANDLGQTADYAFGADGTFVYVLGALARTSTLSTLVLADRNGKSQSLPFEPKPFYHPRISPDGKQIVFGTDDGNEAIVYIYDLKTAGTPRRLTFEGRNTSPIWSADGQRITFASNRDGQRAIYIQPANGGTAERLTLPEAGVDHRPEAWTPDGKTLAYLVNKIDGDIWTVAIDGDRKPKPLVERSGSNERYTAFSPKGRWFAYVSTEVGNRMEVFVQPFPPSSNARYQISTEGGVTPVWSPDGKQLFYGDMRTGRIIAVDINTEPTFSIGKPVALPIERAAIIGNYPGRNFDITPDGKQFIVVMPVASATDTSRRINVVVNWLEELKQRVPVK